MEVESDKLNEQLMKAMGGDIYNAVKATCKKYIEFDPTVDQMAHFLAALTSASGYLIGEYLAAVSENDADNERIYTNCIMSMRLAYTKAMENNDGSST